VTHPLESMLALHAGKELGPWAHFRIARHVRRCGRCSQQVEEFRGAREFLRTRQDEMPVGSDWGALASEMKANIRLGLAAGQIVDAPAHERVHVRWRTPALALPVLLLAIVCWVFQSVHPPLVPTQTASSVAEPPGGAVLQASATSIGVEKDGHGFALLHLRAGTVVSSVSGQDAVRARYVDSDTGQVMISHVYLQ
jgi:hypothetical protein